MKLGHKCDQSGVTVAMVPALSPRPTGPAHPPETAVSALLVGATAMALAVTPPEAEAPQWQDVVLAS